MLRALRITNFAIIDDLRLSFEPGFTVLSGETGAGKSIIIGALGILLGDRATPDLIRTGQGEASVEASFDPAGIALLREITPDSEEGIVIRRILNAQGRSRAFINDHAVSLSSLSSVCGELIAIYGQHEHHGLLRKESHLSFIDTLGGLSGDVAAFRAIRRKTAEMERRIEEVKARARERAQLLDLYRFQIEEIDGARLRPSEEESLDRERAVLMNLARLREDAEAAYSLLYGAEGSCLEQLSIISSLLRDIARVDQTAADTSAVLDSLVTQLKETALAIRDLKDGYEGNPSRLAELDERREVIGRLENKYGRGVAAILQYRDEAEAKLAVIEKTEDDLRELEASLARDRETMTALAEAISQKRRAVSEDVERRIGGILSDLGFRKVRFEVKMERLPALTEEGLDDVEFLFSANPGEAARPLVKIASGGELSRIMLALKSLEILRGGSGGTAEKTLIFDEVDAGIGGETAFHVGNKLKGIARRYQALCITHLPQIAAMADHHFKVHKETHADRVRVNVEGLSGGRREEEIARMLSGKITTHSLKHARELLGQGRGESPGAGTETLFA